MAREYAKCKNRAVPDGTIAGLDAAIHLSFVDLTIQTSEQPR
jgi:hypothetical protein